MPKLTLVDGPWWWRLVRGLKEWLEMGLERHGEVGRGHPVLTSVKVPRELEGMGMEVVGLLVKAWRYR